MNKANLVLGSKIEKSLEKQASERLGINLDTAAQISYEGLLTYSALCQSPLLRKPEIALGREGLFARLLYISEIPNIYYGIGGEEVPLRCIMIPLALKSYRNRVYQAGETNLTSIIFDAWSYDIINSFPSDSITDAIGKDPLSVAEWTWASIIQLVQDDKRLELADKRECLFKAMVRVCGADETDIAYMSASKLTGDNLKVYTEEFMELVRNQELYKPEWVKLVPPNQANGVGYLYIPLEIAEAIMLQKQFCVGVKIGDRREVGFDRLIAELNKAYLFSYTPSAVTPKGDAAPYRNRADILFSFDESQAARFLEVSPQKVINQYKQILTWLGTVKNGENVARREVENRTMELFCNIKRVANDL